MKRESIREQVVREYLEGGTSTRKLGKKYGYGNGTVSRWVMANEKDKVKRERLQAVKQAVTLVEEMPTDVKQLQEELRMSRLKVDLLEAMIDISDEQFGTDIRKKAGTRPS
jgi:transposase